MAINFDTLPKDKPAGGSFELPPEGMHQAKIEEASIKTSAAGNQYLEVVLKLQQGAKIWDRIIPSDKPALQYKLSRFIRACRIPLVGEMELADLVTLVKGREVYVDIIHKEDEYKGEKRTKAEVGIFEGDIYYLPEDINAPAVTDAPTAGTTGTY